MFTKLGYLAARHTNRDGRITPSGRVTVNHSFVPEV